MSVFSFQHSVVFICSFKVLSNSRCIGSAAASILPLGGTQRGQGRMQNRVKTYWRVVLRVNWDVEALCKSQVCGDPFELCNISVNTYPVREATTSQTTIDPAGTSVSTWAAAALTEATPRVNRDGPSLSRTSTAAQLLI